VLPVLGDVLEGGRATGWRPEVLPLVGPWGAPGATLVRGTGLRTTVGRDGTVPPVAPGVVGRLRPRMPSSTRLAGSRGVATLCRCAPGDAASARGTGARVVTVGRAVAGGSVVGRSRCTTVRELPGPVLGRAADGADPWPAAGGEPSRETVGREPATRVPVPEPSTAVVRAGRALGSSPL
jgi:hypothetical protein